ncbi:TetR/AcrR family transcriptional regulator [Siccirubricoccus phaeus]|uniref:TetR/AcrR family transcriptional regulator n=1 Tax=Siccirubricoccus phaeus TaxID=2595053 RepID=UPI0011F172A6|nr:TetR/AcrR family transcriptional regulator [Siccirubricoccus phaeus]
MAQKVETENRGQETRRRILEAAMLRFAQRSYEETTLRDIAADVGVDVALVHRSFGSKERLFEEVVNIAFQPQQLFTADRSELTARLTARVLRPSLDQALHVLDPLDILIRNLLSREAIPLLREAIARDVVVPLGSKLDDPAPQRAALLAACLAGISIFRNVLMAEPLLEDADAHLESLISDIISTIAGKKSAVRRSPCKAARKAPRKKPARPRRSS